MATYNPSTRPEQIDTLISGVDRYNPHNLPLLHEYLEAQLKNEHDWDCMAALAVLKLYQFNPTTFTYPMVISLLAKSLHAIPSPDFNLCLALLGEAPVSILPQNVTDSTGDAAKEGAEGEEQTSSTSATATAAVIAQDSTSQQPQEPSAGILTDPTIVKLHQLATLLSSSRYPTFWTTLQSSEFDDIRQEVLKDIVDFEDGVRKVVLHGTSGAFKSISKQRLTRYLGFKQESQVDAFLAKEAQGWTVKGDVVEIPANKDNVVKPAGVVREEVGLGELTRLLQQAAPSVARA